MPTLQSSGLGSGIDINGLVSKLVAAERAPAENRLTRTEKTTTTQISAFGALSGALSTLQASSSALKTENLFITHKATSSDPTVFTATADQKAAAGSYSIEVTALASAHQLHSAPYLAGSTAPVGTGTLTLTSGGTSFSVVIGDTAKTLADIRDAINAATGNDKVQATIVTAADGARLVLSARQSGSANAIKVTTTGGDGGLSALVYDPGVTTNLTQLAPAQDASVKIAGFTVTAAGNTVSGAIDGVTLNLASQKPGTTLTLSISDDTSSTLDRVRKLVTDFNAVANLAAGLRKFDAGSKSAGPLLGDAMLRGIESSVRRDITMKSSAATAPYDTLAAVGLTLQADGTLKLDETKFNAALTANSTSVARLFGGTSGVATHLYDTLETFVGASGQVKARTTTLQGNLKAIADSRAALDARMAVVQERYMKQFNAMDTMLASMQNTSNYLTQQLAASAKIVSGK
jgi:flagellar hook-associated protein 2